mmetsp:Transcript_7371/g.16019  ORF Transcript_7371/g.16019 Transcript_7371/m.16019 type:complete len:371 (-) Transcript_7371:18-1130(-)
MSSNPSTISNTSVNIARSVVKHISVCHGSVQQVPCSGVCKTFWLSGTSRCVKVKQCVFRIHRSGRTIWALTLHLWFHPYITTFHEVYINSGTFKHKNVFKEFTIIHSSIDHILEWNFTPPTKTFISCEDILTVDVVNTITKGLRAESCKYNTMWSTNTNTSKHNKRSHWDHRHVYCHWITFFHPIFDQNICNTRNFSQALLESKLLYRTRLVPFPNNCNIVTFPIVNMPINTINTRIDLATSKKRNIAINKRSGHTLLKFPFPSQQLFRLFAPELGRVVDGLGIQLIVRVHAFDIRPLRSMRVHLDLNLMVRVFNRHPTPTLSQSGYPAAHFATLVNLDLGFGFYFFGSKKIHHSPSSPIKSPIRIPTNY